MTRTRLLFAAAIFAVGCTRADAQGTAPAKWPDTLSAEIDNASIAGDLARTQAARALAERVATAYSSDGLILHYAGYANYREATVLTGKGLDPGPPLQRAQDFLERSLKAHKLPETHALIAAVNGQLIAKDPSRGMELGIASQASMMAALASGANNPRVWLIRGMSTLFTPPEYGGGVAEAENQLKRAVELFAKDAPKKGEPSWGKAEVHVWLGQVYEQKGDKTKAAAEYKAALDIAPGYAWAKTLAAAIK